MADVYLGLGLFQCALANEPGIVKVAIKILNGFPVSRETGLAYLRICSDSSLYTREGAKQYLIEYLLPQIPKEAAEKQIVLESLQSEYPLSAYYVFQDIDEQLCFHRDTAFSAATILKFANRIEKFDTSNYSLARYANLVRWQCATIDSSLIEQLHPVSFARENEFSFYPVFLQAVEMRHLLDKQYDLTLEEGKKGVWKVRKIRDKAYSLLHGSQVHAMRREYYLWHMGDGLP
jgi:hypothetical protein